MPFKNILSTIQSNKTTTVKLNDGFTKIQFTGNPPLLDRPVFLLNDEGDIIGALPEGEHTLESGKVAIIDKNGILKGVKEASEKPSFVELKQSVLLGIQELISIKSQMDSMLYSTQCESKLKNETIDKAYEAKMSKEALDQGAEHLVSLGEIVGDEWEEVETRETNSHTIAEGILNAYVNLSLSVSGDARKRSKQDTSLFKVRYKYAGNPNPQRGFCRTLMAANKVYRYEDLKAAENMVVNAGFGKGGSNTYSIWKYKGGVNCKHFWERVIYLKKNNKRIGVNEARKMILDLEPTERNAAKWDQNEKEVAQIAGPNNNYWRVN